MVKRKIEAFDTLGSIPSASVVPPDTVNIHHARFTSFSSAHTLGMTPCLLSLAVQLGCVANGVPEQRHGVLSGSALGIGSSSPIYRILMARRFARGNMRGRAHF